MKAAPGFLALARWSLPRFGQNNSSAAGCRGPRHWSGGLVALHAQRTVTRPADRPALPGRRRQRHTNAGTAPTPPGHWPATTRPLSASPATTGRPRAADDDLFRRPPTLPDPGMQRPPRHRAAHRGDGAASARRQTAAFRFSLADRVLAILGGALMWLGPPSQGPAPCVTAVAPIDPCTRPADAATRSSGCVTRADPVNVRPRHLLRGQSPGRRRRHRSPPAANDLDASTVAIDRATGRSRCSGRHYSTGLRPWIDANCPLTGHC